MNNPIKTAVDPIDGNLEDAVQTSVRSLSEVKQNKALSFIRSPLRYPGGKTRAVQELIHYFPPDNDCEKVRNLYKGHKTLIPKWAYGMNGNKIKYAFICKLIRIGAPLKK